MNRLSLVLLVLGAICYVSADYCGTTLCKGGNHVACGNNGKFASICPSDAAMVTVTPALKTVLVNAHNAKRNYVAGGGDAKHSAACRMGTMAWDDEMASIAAFNVKQCAMKHDACRNTATFKYSGQNLAWMGYFNSVNNENMLNQAVNMWFDEISNSNMTLINSYPSNYNGPVIGHFTVMMNEKNIRLGCAASTYSVTGQSYKAYLLACNYASTNMVGHPIYTACSTAGSGCSSGTNPSYHNLCSASEAYKVNNWF